MALPATTKIKITCENCNRVRLKEIEAEAEEFIRPLILGEPTTLGVEAQRKVAASLYACLR
jgi:hypothetical protein